MKSIIMLCLISFFVVSEVLGQKINLAAETKDSNQVKLIQHFKVLDEAAKNSKGDTVYCCWDSITFLEKETYISAGTIGNVIGTFGFTKEALNEWHEWYEKKYSKKSD